MQCYERQGKTKQRLIDQRINYDSKDVEFDYEFTTVICVDITQAVDIGNQYTILKKIYNQI